MKRQSVSTTGASLAAFSSELPSLDTHSDAHGPGTYELHGLPGRLPFRHRARRQSFSLPLSRCPPPISTARIGRRRVKPPGSWLSVEHAPPVHTASSRGFARAVEHCAVSRTRSRHILFPKSWGREDVRHGVRLRHARSPCGIVVSASVRISRRVPRSVEKQTCPRGRV